MSDPTCYIERSKVREILIGQPDESLYITEEILREVDALPIVTAEDILVPAQGSGDCGIMCQDLGKEAGCRYLKPERETLRRLVDIVYQHATESEAVPATLTADLLIDRAYALSSTSGGTAA